jgi:dihydropyrimidine dehydrogenase (NAD+) subunit PreA
MLDHAIGPNVIRQLTSGMQEAMDKNSWKTVEEFRGLRRDRVVSHSKIRRPDSKAYHGGYEGEGYANKELQG